MVRFCCRSSDHPGIPPAWQPLDAYNGKDPSTTLGINFTVTTGGTTPSAVEWYQQQQSQSHMFHSSSALNPLAAMALHGGQPHQQVVL